MKVSNNRIGSTSLGKSDASKDASKTDALGGLGKDLKTKAPTSRGEIKDSANVNVSERAQMMQRAKDIASQPDGIDDAKVARLQKLIDEGKYNVDAQSIADRLVEEHMTIPD